MDLEQPLDVRGVDPDAVDLDDRHGALLASLLVHHPIRGPLRAGCDTDSARSTTTAAAAGSGSSDALTTASWIARAAAAAERWSARRTASAIPSVSNRPSVVRLREIPSV